jgi:hypothetical protein
LDEIFWCAKISQKMLNSQTCWAWGKGAPNPTREGRMSGRSAPKKHSAPCLIYWYFVPCSNECDLPEVSVSVFLESQLSLWKRRQYALEKFVGLVLECLFLVIWYSLLNPLGLDAQLADVETVRTRFRDLSQTCFCVLGWLCRGWIQRLS